MNTGQNSIDYRINQESIPLQPLPDDVRNYVNGQEVLSYNSEDESYLQDLISNYFSDYPHLLQVFEQITEEWDQIKFLMNIARDLMWKNVKPAADNQVAQSIDQERVKDAIGPHRPHTKCNHFNYTYIKVLASLCRFFNKEHLLDKFKLVMLDNLYAAADLFYGDYGLFYHGYLGCVLFDGEKLITLAMDPFWSNSSKKIDRSISDMDYTEFRGLAPIIFVNVRLILKNSNNSPYEASATYECIQSLIDNPNTPLLIRLQAFTFVLEYAQFDEHSSRFNKTYTEETIRESIAIAEKAGAGYLINAPEQFEKNQKYIDARKRDLELSKSSNFDEWRSILAANPVNNIAKLFKSKILEELDKIEEVTEINVVLALLDVSRIITISLPYLQKEDSNLLLELIYKIEKLILNFLIKNIEGLPETQLTGFEVSAINRRGISESVNSAFPRNESEFREFENMSQSTYLQSRSLITILAVAIDPSKGHTLINRIKAQLNTGKNSKTLPLLITSLTSQLDVVVSKLDPQNPKLISLADFKSNLMQMLYSVA